MKTIRPIIQNATCKIGCFVLKLLYVAGIAGLSIALAFAYIYFFGTPDASLLQGLPLAQTSTFYDRTGTHVLYQLHGEENRKVLTHDQIPDVVRQATVATEDSGFYTHHGVDFTSIARALIADVKAGRIEQGGSTITQQLARNAFFSRERTLKRKILETVMALKIEEAFSKNEILDMYLNRVPYGANAYGVEMASKTYFGVSAQDISLDEAALLASLTKAPSLYSPYSANRLHTMDERNRTLSRMAQSHFISNSQMAQAMKVDTASHIISFSHPIEAPHFVFFIIDQLERRYGREVLDAGGWNIRTTINWDMQQQAQRAVREGAVKNATRNASNAALTAVDPKTGEILAMVGSKDFFDASIDGEVNVTTRLRQPGSSFKPLVYATAFSKGFQPETLLTDKPINFGADGSGSDYVPNNYDGQFHGTLPMRSALAQSLNIPAVQTLYLAGIQATIDMAHRLGITTLNETNRYGLALVLGGGEVKLLDMTSAYGVFAQEGMRAQTHGTLTIADQSGRTVEDNTRMARTFVFDPEVARKINSVLSDNQARSPVFGSHSPLILPDRSVAVKTGTTQDFHDAWTIGYTPSLAVGVWAGNNDNRPMNAGSDGVYVAAPIWHDFMQAVTKNTPAENFTPYMKVESDKLLLTGKYDASVIQYYNINSGKKISPEKAAKKNPAKVRTSFENTQHSILYYVNKNDPLGGTPPDFTDPMLPRWENDFIDRQQSDISSTLSPDAQVFISARDYYGKN